MPFVNVKFIEGVFDADLGLVNGTTIPSLLQLVRDGRIETEKLGTHKFALDDIMEAYDVFAAAGEHHALKVVLSAA